ncbi:MAG: ribonuclease HI family protein [Candidatus Korobacteraceae bacterium]
MPYRAFPFRKKASSSSSAPKLFGAPMEQAPETYLIAHVDGGARGNPGPAGFGVVIEDNHGQRVKEISRFVGLNTNNYAEYMGLLAALEFAAQHPARAIKVISDSELMVRQIGGVYKVRSENLRELYERAKLLIRKLQWFSMQHTLREGNRDADRLANEAMDEGMRGVGLRKGLM